MTSLLLLGAGGKGAAIEAGETRQVVVMSFPFIVMVELEDGDQRHVPGAMTDGG
jgi:hypothetical protein